MIDSTEFYFTLKAYSKGPGSLKFELDFTHPFATDTTSQEPQVYIDPKNSGRLKRVLDHVIEIYRFINNPIKYGGNKAYQKKYKLEAYTPDTQSKRKEVIELRKAQQEMLKNLMDLQARHEGPKISRVLYNQNSVNRLTVSFDQALIGNGDMKPPRS